MFAFNRLFDAFRAVVVIALPLVPLVCISIWGPSSDVLSNVLIGVGVAAVMVVIVLLASSVQHFFRNRAVMNVVEKLNSAGQFVGRLDKDSYRRLRPVWAPKLMGGQAAAPLIFVSTDVGLQIWIMAPEYVLLSIPWWAVQSVSLVRGRSRSPRIVVSGVDPGDPFLPLTVIVARGRLTRLALAVKAFAERAGTAGVP